MAIIPIDYPAARQRQTLRRSLNEVVTFASELLDSKEKRGYNSVAFGVSLAERQRRGKRRKNT